MTASNCVFNPRRFLRLCWANVQNNWKPLGLYTGIISLICLLFIYNSSISETAQIPYFAYGFLSFVIISLLLGLSSYLASKSVAPLKKRDSACHELMLPASRLEKFTVIVLFQSLIIPVLLWLIVGLTAYVLHSFSGTFRSYISTLEVLSSLIPQKLILIWILAFLLNQSFFIAGSSFFRKRPMLKLISLSIALLILSALISAKLLDTDSPLNLYLDLVNKAVVETGYNKTFWLVLAINIGLSTSFIAIAWRKFSRKTMP